MLVVMRDANMGASAFDQTGLLIVDDDVDHLLVSKLILERRGYDVLTLLDCEDLVKRIKIYRPGLIFLDLIMPDMSGLEATRLMRSDANCRGIPIVYFSIRDDIAELAERAGADDFLSKPFEIDEMVKMTRKFIKSIG